jgi:hypothetical protein
MYDLLDLRVSEAIHLVVFGNLSCPRLVFSLLKPRFVARKSMIRSIHFGEVSSGLLSYVLSGRVCGPVSGYIRN